MNLKFRPLGVFLCGALVVGSTIGPMSSYAAEFKAMDPRDIKDRQKLAGTFGKTVATAIKVSAGCHRARNSGKLAQDIDCNDLSATEGDGSGKFGKAATKMAGTGDRLDADSYMGSAALAPFLTCPEPCGAETGVTNPMASYSEVGDCLACLAADVIERRNDEMLGGPAGPLSGDDLACASALGSGYAKRLATLLKSRLKCQSSQDKVDNFLLQPCDTSDTGDKIAGATAKAELAIDAACASANLMTVGACADTNVTDLKACALAADDAAANEVFASAFGLDP